MPAIEKIAIVGAGPAGVAAAVQCARLGVKPVVLELSGKAGGLAENAFSIENYPGLEPIEGPGFARLLQTHLERFGLCAVKARVERVTPEAKSFLLECDIGRMSARSLIAAVGTEAKALAIPGASELKGNGLYYELTDLLNYSAPSQKTGDGSRHRAGLNPAPTRDIVVVGGGEAALDYSLSLARLGAEVKILVRGDRFRAAGRLVDLVEKSESIRAIFNATPRSIQRKGGGIEVEIASAQEATVETANAVVVAIGRRSRASNLINGLDSQPSGMVSTRFPGLFVAGDARTGTLGQAGIAVGDGLEAAARAVAYVSSFSG